MTLDLEQLRSLQERLEKATGPDRELSNDIQRAIGGWSYVWNPDSDSAHWHAPGKEYADTHDFLPPDVTASIDAALALVERLLPGCGVELQRVTGCSEWWCQLTKQENGDQFEAYDAPTPALAILRALVAALIAKVEANHV